MEETQKFMANTIFLLQKDFDCKILITGTGKFSLTFNVFREEISKLIKNEAEIINKIKGMDKISQKNKGDILNKFNFKKSLEFYDDFESDNFQIIEKHTDVFLNSQTD
jgi:hypothetical protein